MHGLCSWRACQCTPILSREAVVGFVHDEPECQTNRCCRGTSQIVLATRGLPGTASTSCPPDSRRAHTNHAQVPWGIANGLLCGGARDLILFWGLALYAVCGCYAQDLRAREAAAVGTVFARGDLTDFYGSTSFIPGLALLDGRQDLRAALSELPVAFLMLGMVGGSVAEAAVASFLLAAQ